MFLLDPVEPAALGVISRKVMPFLLEERLRLQLAPESPDAKQQPLDSRLRIPSKLCHLFWSPGSPSGKHNQSFSTSFLPENTCLNGVDCRPGAVSFQLLGDCKILNLNVCETT